MSATESTEMFKVRLPKDRSPGEDVLQLANELDFLPLAIKQATGFIKSIIGQTVTSYLMLFNKSGQYQKRLLLKIPGIVFRLQMMMMMIGRTQ